VRPAEDADKKVAEVRQGLIRFIENQSNARRASMRWPARIRSVRHRPLPHRAGVRDDDGFDQDIRIRHIPNPFAVVWDPLSVDPTGQGRAVLLRGR
jgi:hypothetical protein